MELSLKQLRKSLNPKGLSEEEDLKRYERSEKLAKESLKSLGELARLKDLVYGNTLRDDENSPFNPYLTEDEAYLIIKASVKAIEESDKTESYRARLEELEKKKSDLLFGLTDKEQEEYELIKKRLDELKKSK